MACFIVSCQLFLSGQFLLCELALNAKDVGLMCCNHVCCVDVGKQVLAIPAVPLTMSAGLLFGSLYGTILVSISGTLAATASFLIARYLARDRIVAMAKNNKKFLAIDKAIGEDSFRVVTLLRLSPLLPFSIGNYLYGLTSVKLLPYVLGRYFFLIQYP
jgi:uncharacterized membrane protein YdjX (TVP38/TMEM64 family)